MQVWHCGQLPSVQAWHCSQLRIRMVIMSTPDIAPVRIWQLRHHFCHTVRHIKPSLPHAQRTRASTAGCLFRLRLMIIVLSELILGSGLGS